MQSFRPVTILHVVRQFHPGIGGMESFVEQLATRQAADGHSVRVVTLDRIFDAKDGKKLARAEVYRGVEIVRVPFVGSRRYPLAPRVLKTLKGADLVHVHGIDFFCDFLSATAWLHRRPMVLTTHGGFFHTDFARFLKKVWFRTITRTALSQYGAVIACSDEDARRFREICDSKLVVIPNPVDIDKFRGLADPSSSTIIYFGRLAPNKRIDRLMAWFAGLARSSDWRLIVAGKPMGVAAESVEQWARELGIADRVEVHDSPDDDQLRQLIARSAVYVCASSYEGFGLAAIEAVSAGLFPVLSDIPAFADNVRRLGFGMLMDFDDKGSRVASYEHFEACLQSFRNRFRSGDVREAVALFAWSAAIPAFDDLYDRVMGRTKRRIGTVNVAVMDRHTACKAITSACHRRQPMMVAFCNAHTVNLATAQPGLAHALDQALVLNDGVGVDLASRMLFGVPFPDNLNGTDFVPNLIASSDQLRLFLLGGEKGVAEAAASRIEERYPHAAVVGTFHGYFEEKDESEVLQMIKTSNANMVLVAMGQPRQELWAANHVHSIRGPVLCVGGLFDFLAERVPRAPILVRKLRLEWAFRLVNEPRRLARRYLVGNPLFLGRVIRQRLIGARA